MNDLNASNHRRVEPLNDLLSRPADTLSSSDGQRDGVRSRSQGGESGHKQSAAQKRRRGVGMG